MMKKALIIPTGGTIVSVDRGSGAAPDAEAAGDIISAAEKSFAELGFECAVDMIFGPAGCDSSDMSPERWLALSQRIDRAAGEGIDKVLILHGTDTMAYTAAWLSLTEARASVVLTGSQRTPEAEDFDGTDNVRGAAGLLARQDRGVSIYFCGKVFPGPFAHKADAESLDAYTLTSDKRPAPALGAFAGGQRAIDIAEASKRVSLIHVYPGIRPVFDENASVLIIEGYGAGNMPQCLHERTSAFYSGKKPAVIAASSCEKGLKKPGFYGGVGIAGLAEKGFAVFGQGEYSIEFLTALSCLAVYTEPDAPEKILKKYLERF